MKKYISKEPANISESFLDEQLRIRNIIRKEGEEDKKFGFDLPYKHFLKLMYACFTSQSYSGRIEARIIIEYGLTKIGADLDRGDCINKNRKYGEIKVSYKTLKNQFNFVQIRPHQDLDFYILQCINQDEDFRVYNFFLTKAQMTTFMEMFGASNCHGVVENKTDRTKEEKRMTVTFESDAWKHLMDNHLTEEIVKTLQEF